MGEGGQKVQTSSYKMSEFQACMATTVNNIVYLKVAERLDIKSSQMKIITLCYVR